MKKKIVILEDQPFIPQKIAKQIQVAFPNDDIEVEIIEVPIVYGDEDESALREIAETLTDSVDLIISDYQAGEGIDFAATAAELLRKNPEAKVIGNSNNYNNEIEKIIAERLKMEDFKLHGRNSLSKSGDGLMKVIAEVLGIKQKNKELSEIH